MTKFMPFWFIDVVKTEEKLSRYAAEGQLLTDFTPWGRFTFEDSEPSEVKFEIAYAKKCGGNLPSRLAEKGWAEAAGHKNFYIAYTDKSSKEAGPSTAPWVSFYRIFQVVIYFMICFTAGFIIGASAALIEKGAVNNLTKAAIIAVIFLFTILFGVLFGKIHASNKKLLSANKGAVKFDFTIPKENFTYTPKQEKDMLKSKQMIKKSPYFWISAPDKAEAMVEKMASEGWKFYRFDKLGSTFYFIKSEPCRLRFTVDFQDEITDEYIALTREDGWKLEFTSITRTAGYCIWSKEYGDDDEVPEIYSDGETSLAHAKNYLLKTIVPIAICVPICIFLIIAMAKSDIGGSGFVIGYCIFMAILVVEYSFFAIKSFGYYLRLKKKINNN